MTVLFCLASVISLIMFTLHSSSSGMGWYSTISASFVFRSLMLFLLHNMEICLRFAPVVELTSCLMSLRRFPTNFLGHFSNWPMKLRNFLIRIVFRCGTSDNGWIRYLWVCLGISMFSLLIHSKHFLPFYFPCKIGSIELILWSGYCKSYWF